MCPFALNRLHRFALADVARVIAVSEGVARGLRAQGIFADEKIRVVPNGISVAQLDAALLDLDLAEVRRAHSINAPLLVGTIGELSAVKGQEDYVRAAALIIGREKFEDAQFLIIGDDNSRDGRTRARLEELIAAHGLQKHVRLSGYVSNLTPLIAAFDLYVSLHARRLSDWRRSKR
jgi:glycosyltransferase involved in cell wall biosynthesis